MTDLEHLRQFCLSAEQERKLDAVIAHDGNQAAAADSLGINAKTVSRAMTTLKARANAAPQECIKGRSTLRDADGNVKLEWTKTQFRFDHAGAQKAFMAALTDAIPKAAPVSRRTNVVLEDKCNCFILTDYHLGMNSWKEETGANWDTDIAEDLLVAWFSEAIRMAPKAHTAILGQLGDFIHWDGLDAVTPASGHLLDADTRFQLVVRVAIRALRRIIAELLKKHERVHIIMADANHDPAGGAWLREMFAAFFEDEPRITVEGLFWSPFAPTVRGGRLDTDLLVSRQTSPLEPGLRSRAQAVHHRAVEHRKPDAAKPALRVPSPPMGNGPRLKKPRRKRALPSWWT